MFNIYTIYAHDKNFPKLLREIPLPPALLYVRGIVKAEEHCLAIVGTRKPTRYGMEATEKIIRELAHLSNLTIVSGLATGIDTVAHLEALKNNLRTIAVLGTGIDKNSIFPPQNKNLAEKIIAAGGAVISEYPEGTPGLAHHFPERNRIISGLSLGTIIIEAKEKSGALITARLSLDQNREVFALPGSIFSPNSFGPHLFIKRGAKLVTSAEDIIEELNVPNLLETRKEKQELLLTKEEKIISDAISNEPLTVDELKASTQFSTSGILSILTMLELKGLIKRIDNGQWIKA